MASGGFAPVTADLVRERQVTVLAPAPPAADEITGLARAALAEAAAGHLRPVIGQVRDLAEAASAHAAIEARETIGKTLLTVAAAGQRRRG
jgi:NADPH2:quinone reductase